MAFYGRPQISRQNKFEIIIQAMLVKRQMKDIAESTNTNERTLRRIVANPEFQQMFKEAKLKLMDDAMLKLRNSADVAVDTLIELCTDKFVAPAVRLAAACRILEFGNDADTKERFESRLEKMEEKTVEGAVIVAANNDWTDSNGSIDAQTDYETGEDRTCAA